MSLLAQGTIIGNITGYGSLSMNSLGCTGGIACALGKFGSVISITIGVLTVSAGLYFMVQVFSSSFQWLSSGGDKQALEAARKRLSHAIIGLLMVVLSYALISIIGLVFGLNILSVAGVLNFHP